MHHEIAKSTKQGLWCIKGYADVWIGLSYFILYSDNVYLKKQRSSTECIMSIHCAPNEELHPKNYNTQFASSTWLLVQDHGMCLYVANSIIGPVKAGICLLYCCGNPTLFTTFNILVVMNSLCRVCLLAVEIKRSTHYKLCFWQQFEYHWKVGAQVLIWELAIQKSYLITVTLCHIATIYASHHGLTAISIDISYTVFD